VIGPLLESITQQGLSVLVLIDEVMIYARSQYGQDSARFDALVDFFQGLTQAIVPTPPTMLRKTVVSTTGKRSFLDAEYHVNAFLVNFNAPDQRADQFPPAQPIQVV